jgi:hypothetical protein
MKRELFKILEKADKEYERAKWEKRKKKRKCEGNANNPNCELPAPDKSISYSVNYLKFLGE